MTIENYLNNLFQLLGVDVSKCSFDVQEDEEKIKVILNVPEEDINMVIGSHGETLDSLETILRMSVQEQYPDKKITIDLAEYRAQQEERLKEKTLQVAEAILRTGKEFSFGNLNSYERFLVHSLVANDPNLTELETFSEDTSEGRVLVLRRKNETHD